MDTPIVIDPVIETPAAVAEPEAPAKAAETPAAAPAKSFEERLDDFMHGRTDEDPSEEPAAQPKVEQAAPTTAVKPAETPAAAEAPKSQPAKVVKDYTGLTADEAHMFKNMSNEAYLRLRPVYDAHKKIVEREKEIEQREKAVKEAMPKGVFDHEQAYTLSPQFSQLSSTVQRLEFERGYWAKQFAAIEKGEDYKPLLIDANGRYVEGKPQRATAEAKAEILNNMTLATQLHSQHNQQLQMVQQSFAQRRQELIGGIQSYEKKLFGFLDDEKNPYRPVVQEVLQAIPAEFRDHPLAPFLAKAMATIKAQSVANANLAKQVAAKQTAVSDARKAGPTMTRTNAAVSATRPASADIDLTGKSPEEIIAAFKSATS